MSGHRVEFLNDSPRSEAMNMPRSHEKVFENHPRQKMTRLARQKLALSFSGVSTAFQMVKKWVEKVCRFRKPLLSAAMVQYSICRGAPVCWISWRTIEMESSLFYEKIFPLFRFSRNRLSRRNVWELCLWAQRSVNNQASSLNHDASRRKIERGDVSGLVWIQYRLTSAFLAIKVIP